MQLELVSHPLCPYVHRAAILLREKDVAHEVRYVDLANKPEWFTKISPRGKVPLLIADGTVIFESSVIVEFLDETHPPHIVPSDAFERARQRAWIEVASDLFAAQYKLIVASTPAELETARKPYDAALARFEAELGGDFFAGETFGLVDVMTAPALTRTRLLDAWSSAGLLRPFPKVAAWAARLAQRPSVKLGVPEGFEEKFRALVKKGILLA